MPLELRCLIGCFDNTESQLRAELAVSAARLTIRVEFCRGPRRCCAHLQSGPPSFQLNAVDAHFPSLLLLAAQPPCQPVSARHLQIVGNTFLGNSVASSPIAADDAGAGGGLALMMFAPEPDNEASAAAAVCQQAVAWLQRNTFLGLCNCVHYGLVRLMRIVSQRIAPHPMAVELS